MRAWRVIPRGPRESGGSRTVLPASTATADLLIRDAGVERNRVGDCREGGGLRDDAGVVSKRQRQLGEDAPIGPDITGSGGAGADALEAAVGMGDRAVFLGVGLEREDDV